MCDVAVRGNTTSTNGPERVRIDDPDGTLPAQRQLAIVRTHAVTNAHIFERGRVTEHMSAAELDQFGRTAVTAPECTVVGRRTFRSAHHRGDVGTELRHHFRRWIESVRRQTAHKFAFR